MGKEIYNKRKELLTQIGRNRQLLSFNHRKILMGQVKSGDFIGAEKGLNRLIKKANANEG